MRRPEFSMERADAIETLHRAELIRFASTTPEGEPVLRTLNAVVVGDHVLFHGSRVGEKVECLGRPVVLAADEVVATIPSYFVDPTLACPATTLYRSVQVHGSLERIDDPELKAAMLQAMMEKYQPEGGYAPISADAPQYARVVRGILVAGVRLDEVSGKRKLGQNRSPAELARVIAGLWRRGHKGDPEAMEAILDANPGLPTPELLCGPAGTRLVAAVSREADVSSAVDLVKEEYWRRGSPPSDIRRSFLGSSAWVGARAPDGALVATARAVSDGAWNALIADVAVAKAHRGRGIGKAVMTLLLDHPVVRSAAAVRLGTADAQRFYASLGFVEASSIDLGFRPTPMLRMGPNRSVL